MIRSKHPTNVRRQNKKKIATAIKRGAVTFAAIVKKTKLSESGVKKILKSMPEVLVVRDPISRRNIYSIPVDAAVPKDDVESDLAKGWNKGLRSLGKHEIVKQLEERIEQKIILRQRLRRVETNIEDLKRQLV